MYYAQAGFWNRREEGLAILSRKKSIQLTPLLLPEAPNDMPRILQSVILYNNHVPSVIIANTHLSFQITAQKYRILQIKAIINSLSNEYSGKKLPIILCGDFNDTPDSRPMNELFNSKKINLQSAWKLAGNTRESYTFSMKNPWAAQNLIPNRHIDYILVSDLIQVISCKIVLNGIHGYKPVSDHYGILAHLDIGGK